MWPGSLAPTDSVTLVMERLVRLMQAAYELHYGVLGKGMQADKKVDWTSDLSEILDIRVCV